MGIDISAAARVVGVDTSFKNLRAGGVLFLPQRVIVVGQGSTASTYSTTKRQVTSALEVAKLYGFGSPLHLAARELFPENGEGVGTIPVTVYPLDDAGSGVASTGDITPTVSETQATAYIVRINNISSESFVVNVGDSVATVTAAATAAINAVLEMPVIASDGTTKVDLTSKWKGTSANDIFVEVVSSSDNPGTSYAITQPAGGLVNPDVDDALNQVGDVWETMSINCMELADTATLDKFSTFGEGRWGVLTRKPMISVVGNPNDTVNAATTISDARKTDRTNVAIAAPGCNNLPFVIAAAAVTQMVKRANNNPPFDYGSLSLSTLTAGLDSLQWNYTDKDSAVKKGCSTTDVKDGVIRLSDIVTFYHPTGDPTPAYRYVVDIIKLQNVIFNIDLIFKGVEWDGAPLIPDNDPTVNPDAKKPKMAKADVNAVTDSLALNAILSDPGFTRDNTVFSISSQNPKRLDGTVTVKLSGNTNIISVDLNFGFFFGQQTVIA